MDFFGVEITEWIGYLATAFVLLSFTMKKVNTLRKVNMVGGLLFVVYAFMLDPISLPVILTNGAIVLIHLYYLLKKES